MPQRSAVQVKVIEWAGQQVGDELPFEGEEGVLERRGAMGEGRTTMQRPSLGGRATNGILRVWGCYRAGCGESA